MDELHGSESEILFRKNAGTRAPVGIDLTDVQGQGVKPGPRPKEFPRSEKISCRLTKREKEIGERYCKAHGISEAKLLRASYLAATLQVRNEINLIANAIIGLVDEVDDNDHRRTALSAKVTEILKKSSLFLLLILFGVFLSSAPTVAKYFLVICETGKTYIMHTGEAWIYHTGDKDGWEVVPQKNPLPNNQLPALKPSK
jgi:hypothetical protein